MAKAKKTETETAPSNELKFSASKGQLARELAFVGQATETKATIPILRNVKLTFSDKLEMVCTSLDVTTKSQVEMTGLAFGATEKKSTCVDWLRLNQIVKSMRGEEIDLILEENRLRIEAGKSKFSLPVTAAENFPNPEEVTGQTATVSTAALKGLFDAASIATTKEVSRFALSAIKFDVLSDRVEMASTDGHQLARAVVRIPNASTITEAQIPFQAFKALNELLSEAKGDVRIVYGPDGIHFNLDHRHVISRLMSGQFPNLELVFNMQTVPFCKLPVDDLKETVARVMIIANQRDRESAPSINLSIAEGELLVTATQADVGEVADRIEITDLQLPEFDGALNGSYLLNGLNTCQAKEIEATINNPAMPCYFFRSSWLIGGNLPKLEFTHTIMGMRK